MLALEKTGAVNGRYGTRYGLSEQDEYLSYQPSKLTASTLKIKKTRYQYKLSLDYMTPEYLELFCYEPNTTTYLSTYYIATRYTRYEDANEPFDTEYGMLCIVTGNLKGFPITMNIGATGSYARAIRPIVEINLSKVNVGLTGDGSSDSPYSIVAK